MDIEDPFATPETSRVAARAGDLVRGRYKFPYRDGSHKPRGWMRVSNLVSAFSDQFGLRMWEIEQTLRGLKVSGALITELMERDFESFTKDENRDWTKDFIEKAKRSAGANAGAEFGNHRHDLVEHHHAGLPTGHAKSDARRHLSLYASALVRNRLRALPEMQERRVLCESLEVVGTLDNILEDLDTGDLHLADLKTQKRFWTWLEVSAQLAIYAKADAMWDAVEGKWLDMPKVDTVRAMVLWMPREHPSGEPMVDVYEVDIVRGWRTAELAYQVVKERSDAKAARNPRGWLRAAPDITVDERWAARFAAVETREDGRYLVSECKRKGQFTPVVADAARISAERLRNQA